MKEYIIATLATFCFANSHETQPTQPRPEKTEIENDKYQKPNDHFNFKAQKKTKVVFDTTPTNWLKVK